MHKRNSTFILLFGKEGLFFSRYSSLTNPLFVPTFYRPSVHRTLFSHPFLAKLPLITTINLPLGILPFSFTSSSSCQLPFPKSFFCNLPSFTRANQAILNHGSRSMVFFVFLWIVQHHQWNG